MVDDRTENLFALELILDNHKYVCVKASSGSEALEILLEEQDFALILMDVQMPILDGFETVELIRKIENLEHVPIIFLTASEDNTLQIFKGYEAGAVDYMIKPLSPEILRAKVAAFVDLHNKTEEILAQKEQMKMLNSHVTSINKKLIQQNEEKAKRAAEMVVVNKNLTAFTYISSHDLQEPLRKMQNFITILLNTETKNLSAEGKEYLQKTAQTAKRMRLLIDDLLAYSRAGTLELAFEKTDLSKLVNEIIEENADLIKSKNATITVSELGIANINPVQFRQLLENLVSNSLKFTVPQRDPSITIKARVIRGIETKLAKLAPGTNYLNLTFSDNGIGFEARFNERIFEVFQRLHGQDKYTGTGMGLAICKRIVENHKGVIIAGGELNKGAKFDIYLPV